MSISVFFYSSLVFTHLFCLYIFLRTSLSLSHSRLTSSRVWRILSNCCSVRVLSLPGPSTSLFLRRSSFLFRWLASTDFICSHSSDCLLVDHLYIRRGKHPMANPLPTTNTQVLMLTCIEQRFPFYGTSTIVGYLMTNIFYTYIKFYFKRVSWA